MTHFHQTFITAIAVGILAGGCGVALLVFNHFWLATGWHWGVVAGAVVCGVFATLSASTTRWWRYGDFAVAVAAGGVVLASLVTLMP
ncbi:hypothetical protein [Lacticaseibacillus nasuensis]|jgi:hypothetical protein|uniref:Major facilitator superfamily (MFS) profile domain-containing protein n=1 Tax=Lacticaseibacillus nasuensis JCM 17158 TaxID=1291734 RepID=A0A0R1JMH5_9LACO|nr:hypothetical protein [Lacticaseibacillus nasuensis]KRK72525.1 hypothetical protein FD02_GL001498 [Lacticaseibacillus nasuensis JCM 17158]MCX2454737.1 hypothetical protein [Lacticaseibacillus nasuensis]